MKKAKQTLTAALAATLATGVVGSVASAAPIDDLYKAAYNAMVKAQTEKTQTAINEARVAINALPKELDSAKGTFSEAVDKVQQPIYTQIIGLIEKGNKEPKQEVVNEGRKLLVGVEDAYAKTWSSNFDTIQQTIVNNATEAVKAAIKSQKAEDITKAEALVADLKLADNADVKKAVEGMQKDLVEKLDIRVASVEVLNATTLKVTFTKELDKDSVAREDFSAKSGASNAYAKEVKVADDKKSVEVTLGSELAKDKEYTLTVKGIKDSKGVSIKEYTTTVKYEKKDIASTEFKTTKTVRGAKLKDQLLVKDEAGRDITKETKLTFECVENKSIISDSKDGKIADSAKIGNEYTIRVYSGSTLLIQEKLTVDKNMAQTYLGFTVGAEKTDKKFADITPNHKLGKGDSQTITVYYKDALGNEKTVNASQFTKIESLDKDVVTVSSGTTADSKTKVYGKKVGTGLVRVQVGEIDETLEIEVTEDPVADYTINLKNRTVSVAKASVETNLEFTLKDNAIAKDDVKPSSAKVMVWNSNRDEWQKATTGSMSVTPEGVISINGSNLAASTQTNDVRAKLVVKYNGVEQEEEFNVNIQDVGNFDKYAIVAIDNTTKRVVDTIDQNQAHDVALKVYAIDDNGNRTSLVNNPRIVEATGNNHNDRDTDNNMAIIKPGDLKSTGDFTYEVTNIGGLNRDTSVTLRVVNELDVKTSVGAKVSSTTGSTIATAFSWKYGNELGGTIIDLDATLAYVEGATLSNKAHGDTVAVGDTLNLVAGQTKGYVVLNINSVTVRLANGDLRTIPTDKQIQIVVQ